MLQMVVGQVTIGVAQRQLVGNLEQGQPKLHPLLVLTNQWTWSRKITIHRTTAISMLYVRVNLHIGTAFT